MKQSGLFVALCGAWAVASAAPPAYVFVDHSTETLMDKATAQALWTENAPKKLVRLYPVSKWGIATQVGGGFDDSKVCIVTARAMLLPRSGKALVFQPAKTGVAYGTQAGADMGQCRALAKVKLGEAMGSLRTALGTE